MLYQGSLKITFKVQCQASQSVILNWGFQYLSSILNYFTENADMLKLKLFY